MNTVETPPPSYPRPRPRPRRYPRLELAAFVELRRDDGAAVLQLPVRNISRGGVLVGDAGVDLSAFALGATLSVTIVDKSGDLDTAAAIAGRVVRHDAGGMALSWDDRESDVRAVGQFLDRFYSKR